MNKFIVTFCFFLNSLWGCNKTDDPNYLHFDKEVESKFDKNKEAIVYMDDLTMFNWNKVCFPDDGNELYFYKEKEVIVLKLSWSKYFISKSKVKGSPRGKCHNKLVSFIIIKLEGGDGHLFKIIENKME